MAMVTKEKASRKARDLFEKGFGALDRGNLDYAIDMFLNCVDLEPGFLEARKFLRASAVRQFKEKKFGAISHVVHTITGLPKLFMAKALLGKKPLKALHMAEELLRKDPFNGPFVYLLCDVAEVLTMPEIAVQSLELLRDHRPNDFGVLHRLAAAYKENSQMQLARQVYDRLMQMKPNNQELNKEYKDATALATMEQGGWGKANSFRDMVKDTKEAESIEQESKAVKSFADLDSMITDTLVKIESEPDNVNYRRAIAELYTKSNKFEEALAALEDAQKVTGGGDPQVDRAVTSVRLKMFDREISVLTEEGDAAAAQAKQQEREEFVLLDARQRVERYPNDREFKYEYGVLLFGRGELDQAIQQFQAARQNPKQRISSLFYLARCFKGKKQYDIAREQLEQASAELPVMDGMKKDILYELGDLCDRMGQTEAAVGFFKEIYAVDISYQDVADKIEQAYKGA
jgi:tetratricopeptide (TPR) repeat protein